MFVSFKLFQASLTNTQLSTKICKSRTKKCLITLAHGWGLSLGDWFGRPLDCFLSFQELGSYFGSGIVVGMFGCMVGYIMSGDLWYACGASNWNTVCH